MRDSHLEYSSVGVDLKYYSISYGLFSLELSFSKIEMERWSKNLVKSSTVASNAARKIQHPKITSDASPSTSTFQENEVQIVLRKCLYKSGVKFHQVSLSVCLV